MEPGRLNCALLCPLPSLENISAPDEIGSIGIRHQHIGLAMHDSGGCHADGITLTRRILRGGGHQAGVGIARGAAGQQMATSARMTVTAPIASAGDGQPLPVTWAVMFVPPLAAS